MLTALAEPWRREICTELTQLVQLSLGGRMSREGASHPSPQLLLLPVPGSGQLHPPLFRGKGMSVSLTPRYYSSRWLWHVGI